MSKLHTVLLFWTFYFCRVLSVSDHMHVRSGIVMYTYKCLPWTYSVLVMYDTTSCEFYFVWESKAQVTNSELPPKVKCPLSPQNQNRHTWTNVSQCELYVQDGFILCDHMSHIYCLPVPEHMLCACVHGCLLLLWPLIASEHHIYLSYDYTSLSHFTASFSASLGVVLLLFLHFADSCDDAYLSCWSETHGWSIAPPITKSFHQKHDQCKHLAVFMMVLVLKIKSQLLVDVRMWD